MNWITNYVRPKINSMLGRREVPDNLWIKCPETGEMVFHRDLEENKWVIPASGYLSDRIGRRRMYVIGAVAIGAFGFIYFALLNSRVPALMFLAVMLSFVPHGLIFGPQAALFAECFPPRLRYSGTSIGFHLAAITAGGPAPLIATALLAWTGSGYAIAGYIALTAVVSIIATLLMPDHTNKDISHEQI